MKLEPFRQTFMLTYARGRGSFEGMPGSESNFVYPLRNWKDGVGKSGLPAVGSNLQNLANKLQVCYHLTTGGKFPEAVEKFRQLLLGISTTDTYLG